MLLEVAHDIINRDLASNLKDTNKCQFFQTLRMFKNELKSRKEASSGNRVTSDKQECPKVSRYKQVIDRRFEYSFIVGLVVTQEGISEHRQEQQEITFPLFRICMMIAFVSTLKLPSIEQDDSKSDEECNIDFMFW